MGKPSKRVSVNETDSCTCPTKKVKDAILDQVIGNIYPQVCTLPHAYSSAMPLPAVPRNFQRAALESLTDIDIGIIGVIKETDSDDDEISSYKPTPQFHRAKRFLAEANRPASLAIRSVTYDEVYQTPKSPSPKEELSLWLKKPIGCFNHEGYFNYLSDEMVLGVFKLLPRHALAKCARVCHRWYRLTLDETLWKRIALSGRNIASGVIGTVLSRGALYVGLSKAEISTPIFSTNLVPPSGGYRLLYLDLSMASLSEDGLVELLSGCRSLRKLSVENCAVSNKACRLIGKNACLNTLNMSQCEGLTARGLASICSGCQLLQSLNVAWTFVSREAIAYITQALPAGLARLNLSGCRDKLMDKDVLHLVRKCPHLVELDLSDSTKLSRASVEHIARHLHGLQQLSLSRGYRVEANVFLSLRTMMTLKNLNIFGMLSEQVLAQLQDALKGIVLNGSPFSTVARPTVGACRTSIWNERIREIAW